MSLTNGTKIGPYEILAPIGAGGMGEVYRARDTRLGRDVALKILPESFARDDNKDNDRLHRFEQESRAVAALNHPNILAIHDVGEHNGTPFLVSELLEGGSLRGILNEGSLPQRKTIDYGVQIAHGLAAAHEKGIVHRDLKPANVMVTPEGLTKVLDFGLAKLAGNNGALDLGESDTTVSISGPGALNAAPRTMEGAIIGKASPSARQALGQSPRRLRPLRVSGLLIREHSGQRRLLQRFSQRNDGHLFDPRRV